jgi:hypothetical protein
MISEGTLNQASAVDRELPWLQIISERLLAQGSWGEAASYVENLNSQLLDEPGDEIQRIHYKSVAYWLSKAAGVTPKFSFSDKELPELGLDCPSRFINWSWNLANGNIEAANQIARDLIDLGYKHPRMAFYSKLAGVPYPPPNTPPTSLDQEETSTPASIQ